MLGVDKLASCLAVTMTAQCIAVFLGPTISGERLIKLVQSILNALSLKAVFFPAGYTLLRSLCAMVNSTVKQTNSLCVKLCSIKKYTYYL